MICIMVIAVIFVVVLPPIPPKYQCGNVWQPMSAPVPTTTPPKSGSH